MEKLPTCGLGAPNIDICLTESKLVSVKLVDEEAILTKFVLGESDRAVLNWWPNVMSLNEGKIGKSIRERLFVDLLVNLKVHLMIHLGSESILEKTHPLDSNKVSSFN